MQWPLKSVAVLAKTHFLDLFEDKVLSIEVVW